MDRYRIRVAELEEHTKNLMIQIASVEILQQENGNLKAEKADLLNRQRLAIPFSPSHDLLQVEPGVPGA
eukprot:768672-Hanusia_phi.AAC.22